MSHVVVIGAGHAGVAAAAALRAADRSMRVTLVAGDAELPYERPPLSKDMLLGDAAESDILLRAETWYQDNDIELLLGVRADAVDRRSRAVLLDDGGALSYDRLVLATGARPRRFEVVGADLEGVCSLSTLAESRALATRLRAARRVVIVGGGFIGLEVAAAVVGAGLRAVVVEAADRVLARVASPPVSAAVAAHHAARGVDLRLGVGVREVVGENGRVTGVLTSEDELLAADLVVVGIGSAPDDRLAAQAGLACGDGVLVDAWLQTADPAVLAIGDCARFGVGEDTLRIESVQNAVDQARYVAQRLTDGSDRIGTYRMNPLFWSNQGDLRLQIVGLPAGGKEELVRRDSAAGQFSVFRFSDDRLACVESVNHAAGHLAGRKLLAAGASISPDQLRDPMLDLKALASGASAAEPR